MLCIMLSLLFASLAMKKKKPQPVEVELPKMKAPKVIPPQREEEKAEETQQEENAALPEEAQAADNRETDETV